MESVTQTEKLALQWANLSQHLPEDFWYDGHAFWNSNGKCMEMHPNMKVLVEIYLDEINSEIDRQNKEIWEKWEIEDAKYPMKEY